MAPDNVGRFLSAQARAQFDAAYDDGMRMLPEPAEIHDVPTAYGTVRVYRFGTAEGTPLVLLPGRNTTTVIWRPNLPVLAAKRSVYAVDLLGEPGRSEQTAPIRDSGEQAAWLAEVLARFGFTGAHVVGMSIGGWLACDLGVREPARVSSLALLDPVATFARVSPRMFLRMNTAMLPGVSRWARPAYLRWAGGRGKGMRSDDPVWRVMDAGMRGYRIALPAPAYFTDAELRSLSMPVLALVAGRSVVHDPLRAVDRARALVPHVQAEYWADATHTIGAQFAEAVSERVLRFADEVDSR